MKRKNRFLLAAQITICLVLFAGCSFDSISLTVDRAAEIAIPYFKESYGITVSVENVKPIQVGDTNYLYGVNVSDTDGRFYKLCLDKEGNPLADNYLCSRQLDEVDVDAVLTQPCEIYEQFAYKDKGYLYLVTCSAYLKDLPSKESPSVVYRELKRLEASGVQELVLYVRAPYFLTSEAGYGLQLSAKAFSTVLNWETFLKQYNEWAETVFWNEQKFNNILLELKEIGIPNAYFSMKNVTDIVLYYKSETALSPEYTLGLIEQIDESFIRIDGTEFNFYVEQLR